MKIESQRDPESRRNGLRREPGAFSRIRRERGDGPEVRTVIDLMAALMGALDALDVGIVEEETSPAGFVCLLPAGRVRIRLEHGPHVSIFDAGEPDD